MIPEDVRRAKQNSYKTNERAGLGAGDYQVAENCFQEDDFPTPPDRPKRFLNC